MFQQVRDLLGQKDEKGYQKKLEITASVVRVKDVEYSKTSGKPGQSLLIKCGEEEEWVKFQGGKDFIPLDPSAVGKTYVFLVWPFQPDQAPKSYLYCWIQRQVPQNTPQNAPQQSNAVSGDVQVQIMAMAERFVQAVEYLVLGRTPREQQKPTVTDDDIPF